MAKCGDVSLHFGGVYFSLMFRLYGFCFSKLLVFFIFTVELSTFFQKVVGMESGL